jgi:hypothetical protein
MMVKLYLEVDSELFAVFGASVLAAGALEEGVLVVDESLEPRESVL